MPTPKRMSRAVMSAPTNEIRVGTLSGMPASQDVQVEVLNFVGGNISGNYYYEDADGEITFQSLYGGPGGASVFTEVGDTNRDFPCPGDKCKQ